MKPLQPRRVILQPTAWRAVQRGVNQVVEAIRPTLGPRPRIVALASLIGGDRPPELLDNGAVIARRIIQLPDPDEDMGAMLVRSLLWRLHEEVGDGTATAAVLFQAVYDHALRYLLAGGHPMPLRRHLERGLRVVHTQLSGMAMEVRGQEALARLSASLCYDPPLAQLLAEIFGRLGPYGQLDIQPGQGRGLERQYVEGMYWKSGLLSRHMITDVSRLTAHVEDAALVISDLEIEDPGLLVPVIEMAMRARARALVIVAHKLSEGAMGLLAANHAAGRIQAMAVKTPGLRADEQAEAMEDLAMLTGGRPFLRASGDSLSRLTPPDLGRARRAWADRYYFGIVDGQGQVRALRGHLAALRRAFERSADPAARKKLQERIGKLMGGAATLCVGGATKPEMEVRKEMAQRSADALRSALRGGVLPGGGAALLACRPALRQALAQSRDPDERAAYRILLYALEEPARVIIANAGQSPGQIIAEIERAGAGYGFDVLSGKVVHMAQAGIFDAATVQKAVVRAAISSAALALSVEALVHRRVPALSLNP